MKTELQSFLGRIGEETQRFYGPRLVSLCVYGSVARDAATRESDVDLLVIASPLPDGRMARVREFARIEEALAPDLAAARAAGAPSEISALFKTPVEAQRLGSIFLDMTLERLLLFDRDRFLEELLDDLAARLRAKGARRVGHGDSTYWVLVPDLKPGESWSL